jgi:hypothetical protein
MKSILLAVAIAASSAACYAQTVVIVPAQVEAEEMARTGLFGHRGRHGRCREGIGFSTVSADAAVRNCCYHGQLVPREIGVAKGRRGFYAVIRYW